MSQLVCHGEHVTRSLLIIEKHIRMLQTEHADGIGTAALALGFLHVDPAVIVSFLQKLSVLLTQRSQSFLDDAERFLIIHTDLRILHERGINIVHMESLYAENLLAVLEIAMEQRQIGVHAIQKVLVYLYVHVLSGQSHLQAGAVLAGAGQEHVLIDVAHEGGGDGVDQIHIHLVERLESGTAHTAVRGMKHQAVGTVGQAHLLPVHADSGVRQIGVVDHGEDILEAAKDAGFLGKERFYLLGEHVGLALNDAADGVIVILQAGIGSQFFQFFNGQRSQFRIDVGHVRREFHRQHLHAGLQCRKLGEAGILIPTHKCINGKAAQILHHRIDALHARKDGLGVIQFSLIGGKVQLSLQGGVHVLPLLLRGEDVIGIPFPILGHVFSFFCHFGTSFLYI